MPDHRPPPLDAAVRAALPAAARDYIASLERRLGVAPTPSGNDTPSTEYDTVPYPGYAYEQSHPGRLAAVATLFGLNAPPLDTCRVLEIGCGDGANVLPMAHGLPGARFVGLDLAAEPIARGRDLAAAAGIGNVELRRLDLRDVGPSLGRFDYIVAHGVYSWVPPDAQSHLLRVCGELLAPNGVAYVSYNALPGSHLRLLMRDLIRYHTRGIADPVRRIAAAREFAVWVAGAATTARAYGAALQGQAERLATLSDPLLFHDDLAAYNAPVAFHDFLDRAAPHGLRYLGEAEFVELADETGAPEVDAALRSYAGDDAVARYQYLDFLKGRGFRETLLCRADVPLDRGIDPTRLLRLYAASPTVLANVDGADRTYKGATGLQLTTDQAPVGALLDRLAERWPESVHLPDLFREIAPPDRVADGPRRERALVDFGHLVIRLAASGFVDLRTWAPPCLAEPGERPKASRLAREQALRGPTVAALYHDSVRLEDEGARHLLGLLDGRRNRAAVCRDMAAWSGRDGGGVDASEVQAGVEDGLRRLARLGLLERTEG